jgi:hypothetical protein
MILPVRLDATLHPTNMIGLRVVLVGFFFAFARAKT